MSKIRQAVDRDRHLAEVKLKAQCDLLTQATRYEHKLGVQKFHEVQTIQDAHTQFHDREHILYEDALEKASAGIRAQLFTMQAELNRLADDAKDKMTVTRFEREHSQLLERVDAAFARVDEKLGAEERVTVRQGAQSEVLERVAATNRWVIGLTITSLVSLLTLAAKLLGVF